MNIINPILDFLGNKRMWSYLGTIATAVILVVQFTHSPGYKIEEGDPGYKKITVDKAFAHYSFEYPSVLYDLSVNHWDHIEEVIVLIKRAASGGHHEDLSLLATVDAKSDTTIERYLSSVKHIQGGQLLEQSEIMIDDIRGDQLQMIFNNQFTDEDYGVRTFLWLVVFDKDGQRYSIRIRADVELMEEAKAYFEHTLDSFCIEEYLESR